MHTERHDLEQYFFDTSTRSRVVEAVRGYQLTCCLCAPTVGAELHRQGHPAVVLDIDERFSHLPGFRRWDLTRPVYSGDCFDIVVCDPPFFSVSLRQLFAAIRGLCQHRADTPVLMTYLSRRRNAVERACSPIGLRASGVYAGYDTVDANGRNAIEFFSNFPLPASMLGPRP